MTTTFAHHGFDASRQIADLPNDISGELLRVVGVPKTSSSAAALIEVQARRAPVLATYFEIYCADRVNLTSILFSGGDWRWRFCAPDGTPIAVSVGYGSEKECADAVSALREGAGGGGPRPPSPLSMCGSPAG